MKAQIKTPALPSKLGYDLVMTVKLDRLDLFRIKVAVALMKLSALIGGYRVVVQENGDAERGQEKVSPV